jgi:hypothetical protein
VLVQEAAADPKIIALPDKRPCFREALFQDCIAHVFIPLSVEAAGSIGLPAEQSRPIPGQCSDGR